MRILGEGGANGVAADLQTRRLRVYDRTNGGLIMHRRLILSAVSLLALSAGAAWAQEPQALRLGATVDGALTDGDGVAEDEAYVFDDYTVQVAAGRRIEATLTSDAFDAFLEVYAPGSDEVLASDDDGAQQGETHARLRFTPSQAGAYRLRARTLSGVEGGDYRLRVVDLGAAPRPPRPGSLRLGQTVRGALSGGDPETSQGAPYDAWRFRARQGERFAVAMDAEDFDSLVRVGRGEGEGFEELAFNDDGADSGLNARLTFTAPADGDYLIRATAVGSGAQGDYRLSLMEGPPPIPAQTTRIGETVEGELTSDDAKGASGTPADAWRFSGREGQRVRITLSSADFDTYLQLFDAADASLGEDDDGAGDGTNSSLTHTLAADGEYRVEVRAFSEGTGDYTLKIEEVAPPPPPTAIQPGAPVQGSVGETSATDDQSRPIVDYVFTGTEGQRVQAIMRSGDFDTYLRIGKAGDDFAMLAEDDDGLGEGTDSRLNFTLPEDGDYVIRASPLAKDDKGLFSLELVDRGPQPKPGSVLVGVTARGTLTDTDATTEDNAPYDAYRISLKSGEKLRLLMVSNEVDSVVSIGRIDDDGDWSSLASDDDGLSDTHAKLEWTAPDDGEYEIRAAAYQQGQTGAYALIVEKAD